MKITFLGTGTSMGVPVAGAFGSHKLGPDPRNLRSRCSLYVQTSEAGLLIDAGPEFREQSLRCGVHGIDAVMITHEHMDHVSGLDDLRPFTISRPNPIPLYSHPRVLDSIRSRFDYMFGPDRYPGSTSVTLHAVEHPFHIGSIRVVPLPVAHGDLSIYGYRIGDLAYMTDVQAIPQSTMDLLEGVNVLVMGALRWNVPHPSHMTIEDAVLAAEKVGADRTRFIHMNGSVKHGEGESMLPPGIRFAYDQEVIWL